MRSGVQKQQLPYLKSVPCRFDERYAMEQVACKDSLGNPCREGGKSNRRKRQTLQPLRPNATDQNGAVTGLRVITRERSPFGK